MNEYRAQDELTELDYYIKVCHEHAYEGMLGYAEHKRTIRNVHLDTSFTAYPSKD